jgi:DNA segregation ATPase FtsK/SpoIIIE, S-DNA-T family
MGKGATRSQMDVRICLRVRERRDTDLILGQGIFAAGWQAHTLDAPGTFLVSAESFSLARVCPPTSADGRQADGHPDVRGGA